MLLLYYLFLLKNIKGGRLLEIFLVIILGKNKFHVLQQENLMSQLLSHELMDQAV